jgi:hypothetical protein
MELFYVDFDVFTIFVIVNIHDLTGLTGSECFSQSCGIQAFYFG